MNYLLIISGIFFLISVGSTTIHRTKNSDALIEYSVGGKFLIFMFYIIPITFLTIIITNIWSVKWYWSALIVIISSFTVAVILAGAYSSNFGYKSKRGINWSTGEFGKRNLHYMDSAITLVLGIIMFIIGILFNFTDYTIILGYLVLLLIQYFAISATSISIICAILTPFRWLFTFEILNGIILIAGILIWLGLNFIWFKIFDYQLPLLAFALSIGFQLWYFIKAELELIEPAKQQVIGETWAIIFVAIYILVFKDFNLY